MLCSLKTLKLNIPRPAETEEERKAKKNKNNPSTKDLIKQGGTVKL